MSNLNIDIKSGEKLINSWRELDGFCASEVKQDELNNGGAIK